MTGHAFDLEFFPYISLRPVEYPAQFFQVNIDVLFPGSEFGNIFRHECAGLFIFLLLGGILSSHLFNLLLEALNFRILFKKQTLLLFNFGSIDDHALTRNLCFVEGSILVVCAVAVVQPLDELK